jgi:hypothetical protein
MRKILKFPRIRPNQRLKTLSASLFFFTAVLACSGCSIKTTVKVPVPKNIEQDRTATFEELLSIARRNDKIESLTSSRLHVKLTRGKIESGVLVKYRDGPGYILLKRPDSLYLNIQNPFTHSSIFELLSQGDEFKAWDSRDNKLYTGKNSARILVPANSPESREFDFPGRPPHIFDAILPESINTDSPGVRVSCEEQAGQEARYYILDYSKDDGAHGSHLLRKIWIERAGLTIARQQVYAEEGKIASDTQYSRMTLVDGFSFPLTIDMDRPLDGYSLKLELEGLRINRDIGSEAFVIKNRPGTENVPLAEKRSGVF